MFKILLLKQFKKKMIICVDYNYMHYRIHIITIYTNYHFFKNGLSDKILVLED